MDYHPWYPGHMHKASLEIKQLAHQCHSVLMLIDARLPQSSFNHELIQNKIINLKKQKLYRIFTKLDLISQAKYKALQHQFKNAYFADYHKKKHREFFLKWLKKTVCQNNFFSTCLVVGIPNVGKSTFIKQHCFGKQIGINRKPGSTKGLAHIKLTRTIMLYDTPGIAFKQHSNWNHLAKLVLCNLIKSDFYDLDLILSYGVHYLYNEHRIILGNLFPKVENILNNCHKPSKESLLCYIQKAYFTDKDTCEFKNKWILRRIQSKANCEWE